MAEPALGGSWLRLDGLPFFRTLDPRDLSADRSLGQRSGTQVQQKQTLDSPLYFQNNGQGWRSSRGREGTITKVYRVPESINT